MYWQLKCFYSWIIEQIQRAPSFLREKLEGLCFQLPGAWIERFRYIICLYILLLLLYYLYYYYSTAVVMHTYFFIIILINKYTLEGAREEQWRYRCIVIVPPDKIQTTQICMLCDRYEIRLLSINQHAWNMSYNFHFSGLLTVSWHFLHTGCGTRCFQLVSVRKLSADRFLTYPNNDISYFPRYW